MDQFFSFIHIICFIVTFKSPWFWMLIESHNIFSAQNLEEEKHIEECSSHLYHGV